jgi:hypothetical protein
MVVAFFYRGLTAQLIVSLVWEAAGLNPIVA